MKLFIAMLVISPALFALEPPVEPAQKLGKLQGTVTAAMPYPPGRGFLPQQLRDETLIVNKNNAGLKNVLIYLTNKAPAETPAVQVEVVKELEFSGVRLEPRIMTLQRGETLEIRNDAPVEDYNGMTFIYPTGESHRNVMVKKGEQNRYQYTKRYPLYMGINIQIRDLKTKVGYPVRMGYLFVLETSYVAVTDENGAFTISDIPPGEYTMDIWHEVYISEIRGKLTRDGKPIKMRSSRITIRPETQDPGKLEFSLEE